MKTTLRYLPRPAEAARMTAAELRQSFLIPGLFDPGHVRVAMTDADRIAVAGVVPTAPVQLPAVDEFGTSYFTERRELGVFNLGTAGLVTVEGKPTVLDQFDCLYVGSGNQEVTFAASGDSAPAFYLVSCPAHRRLPTMLIRSGEAESERLGDSGHANCRRLRRYIHPDGARSCQLVMGMTELGPGGVWNTMPPHTHSRRSEVYLYFDMPPNEVVFHFLGEPTETRHVIVREREAVISPPWSLHTGVGTSAYRFIWAMAGENQNFSDMDPAALDYLC